MYALQLAKRAVATSAETLRRMLVTEGYLDCIRLHGNGFQNAVATLGTALTPEHVRVLKRYADEAVVLFDGDKAGEQAALRSLDVFLEEGMGIKVLCFPKGFDADDFIQKKGREAMQALLANARDIFDFKLEVMLKRYNKTDSLGLLKITSEFLDTFSRIKNPVLLDRYLKRLALILGVQEASLRSELMKITKRQSGTAQPTALPEKAKTEKKKARVENIEETLLSLFLNYPMYVIQFRDSFPEYIFSGDASREILRMIEEMVFTEQDERASAQKLLNRLDDDRLKAHVSELLVREWVGGDDRDLALQDCLSLLQSETREQRLKTLRNQISEAEMSGDEIRLLQHMRHYQDLLQSK